MSDLKNVLGDIWGAKPEDLQSKQSGNFGLNTGYLTKLDFNDKAGKDGADGNAIDLVVQIKDRDYNNRFFLNTEVYSDKNELVKPGEEGYLKAFKDTYSQIGAVVKHALKAVGVTDEAFDKVPRTPVETEEQLVPGFTADVKNFLTLLPAGYQKSPIDIFLEYQWQPTGDNTRTFLILPKNMKGGYFMIPAVTPVGKWEEVRSSEGLHYVDNAGNKHPFTRSEAYMSSNKAIQQGEGVVNSNTTTPPAAQAQKSVWE